MIIPPEHLSQEAIDNLIAEYCLRDWGLNETEAPLSQRQEQVRAALLEGKLLILYSEAHESAQLVPADQIEFTS